jgi:hypothetical protein
MEELGDTLDADYDYRVVRIRWIDPRSHPRFNLCESPIYPLQQRTDEIIARGTLYLRLRHSYRPHPRQRQ